MSCFLAGWLGRFAHGQPQSRTPKHQCHAFCYRKHEAKSQWMGTSCTYRITSAAKVLLHSRSCLAASEKERKAQQNLSPTVQLLIHTTANSKRVAAGSSTHELRITQHKPPQKLQRFGRSVCCISNRIGSPLIEIAYVLYLQIEGVFQLQHAQQAERFRRAPGES